MTKNGTESKQHVLVTHNDLDGIGGKFLAEMAFGEEVDVYVVGNHEVDRTITSVLAKEKYNEATLWITDVSPSQRETEDLMQQAVVEGRKMVLLDHHASALSLNRFPWAHVQVEEAPGRLASGTSLFYAYLLEKHLLENNPFLDSFVETVRLYDTWEWNKKGDAFPKRVNDLFYLLGMNDFYDALIEKEKVNNAQPFHLSEKEEMILDVEQKKIEAYIRRKSRSVVRLNWKGFAFGVVHAETYQSELGNDLGTIFPHLDAIAMVNVGGKKVSIRTIHEDVDVSKIAQHFGGGGHVKASGFSLDKESFDLFVANTVFEEAIPLEKENQYNVKDVERGTYYVDEMGVVYSIQQDKNAFYCIFGVRGMAEGKCITNNEYVTFFEAERYLKKEFHAHLMEDERYVPIKATEIGVSEQRFRSQFGKIFS